MAFAQYALQRGDRVIFSVPERHYLPLVRHKHARLRPVLAPSSKILKQIIKQEGVDILILCNSKIYNRNDDFTSAPPEPLLPTLSIDSNWLFSPQSPYPFSPWIHRYCLNFPKPIFKLGLKKFGGHYTIPRSVLAKISVVGLIPSYKPITLHERKKIRTAYGITKNEKLIFLYTSIGYLAKPIVFLKALEAARLLRAAGRQTKMIYFGDTPSVKLTKQDREWFLLYPRTSARHFSKVLASSDLVFQHQGLSTLEQSIGAQIPVIATVRDRKNEKLPRYHRHAWEVGPFARYGACAMFYFNSAPKTIANKMEALLFHAREREAMRNKQRTLYSKGEINVYTEAIRLLKRARTL